jgi:hypothetical protein
MQRPSPGLVIVVAALSPISLVLAHSLVYLLAAGDELSVVLRATGHDETWSTAVRLVIVCSALLGLAGLARLAVLWRTARRLERATGPLATPAWRDLGRQLLRVWLGLTLVTVVWFVVQENVERLGVGQHAPILGPLLDGGLTGPLLVIPATALVASLVGVLYRWSLSALLARITAAARPRPRRRPARVQRPAGRVAHPSARLARQLGLRAPPPALAV